MNLKSRFESLVFFQKKYNNLHFITEIPFFLNLWKYSQVQKMANIMAAHIKMLQFTRGTASELKKIIFFKHSKKQCIYAYHIYTIKYTKTHGIHSNNGVQEICNVSWNQEMAKAATSAKEYYLTLHPSMKKKARSSVNKHITNNKIRRKNEKRKVSEKGFFFFFSRGRVILF